jgi:predicted nucleic acid-binding Zn ribbon protein
MKRCPECSSTYPDSERFCSSDGAQLVPAESASRPTVATPPPAAEPAVECPVCGGKALPGEELCSFCGARLNAPEAPPQPSFTIPKQTVFTPPPSASQSFSDEPVSIPEQSGSHGFGLAIYLAAAIIALGAGAWFALHLSRKSVVPNPAASMAGPAASPVASGPIAALAVHQPVQVTGESAADPARNPDAATKLFNDNSASVLDTYKKALAANSGLADGVLASLTVDPAGDVVAGAVKVSTAPNPALDGELIKTMMGWHFAPFSGSSVEVSYPVVMTPNDGGRAAVESALAGKIASMGAGETPEYASAPSAAPAGREAAPSPAAEPSAATSLAAREPITPPAAMPPEEAAPPPAAVAPPPVAPERTRRHRHREYVPAPPPRVSLLTKVQERLRTDRRLGRVKAYTNSGGVVTLYGKVFDDKDRRLAIATVRSVDGVSDVIDSLQTDTAAWAQQEAAIAAQLQGAGLNQVTVKVIGHDAYLSGQVTTQAQKEHAVTVAEGAAPVRVRTNLIRVVPAGVFSSF